MVRLTKKQHAIWTYFEIDSVTNRRQVFRLNIKYIVNLSGNSGDLNHDIGRD